jgi:hypothetical protein
MTPKPEGQMASHLERRKFLATLGGAAAWPLAARAQQPSKLPTIGFLGATPSTESQRVAAFVQRLRELGWIDGRNLAIEYRWAEGRNERYAENAAEFVLGGKGAGSKFSGRRPDEFGLIKVRSTQAHSGL